MTVVTLNLEDVFLFFFKKNISTSCRKVVAIILSLFFMASETFLVVFILLISLALMGRLSTRHVSIEKVSKLNPSEVFLFLFRSPVSLQNSFHIGDRSCNTSCGTFRNTRPENGLSKVYSKASQKWWELEPQRSSWKMHCKFFLVFLETKNTMAGTTAIKRFALRGLASWSDILSSDSEGGKKLKKSTEGHFLQEQL